MNNPDQLREALTAAARRVPPSGQVPYAFEKRVMAHVLAMPRREISSLAKWTTAFWRAGLSGAALATVLLVVDGVVSDPGMGADGTLARDAIEQTLMASAESTGEPW